MLQKPSYELLGNTKDFLENLENEIDKAKSTIDLQFYTFEADRVGNHIAKALFRAKLRGVRVRFIIDHFIDIYHNDHFIKRPRFNRRLHKSIINEWLDTKALIAKMAKRGIEIKRTSPLGFLLRLALVRDHKKIVIIDGKTPNRTVAYLGGANLSEHNALWNDFMVKMQGDMTPLIQEDFDSTWDNKSINKVGAYSDGVVLTDSRHFSEIIPYVKNLIDNAKTRVILESPYLGGKHIKQSLMNAAKRGIDVSFITPLHNNKKILAPSKKSLKKLTENRVKVYRYAKHGGMTHQKALLVDDMAVFGSSNFNEFFAGRLCEINIATLNKSMVLQLEEKLLADIRASKIQKLD